MIPSLLRAGYQCQIPCVIFGRKSVSQLSSQSLSSHCWGLYPLYKQLGPNLDTLQVLLLCHLPGIFRWCGLYDSVARKSGLYLNAALLCASYNWSCLGPKDERTKRRKCHRVYQTFSPIRQDALDLVSHGLLLSVLCWRMWGCHSEAAGHRGMKEGRRGKSRIFPDSELGARL
jgi:hypothetical protein